jgi:hypothetical protein
METIDISDDSVVVLKHHGSYMQQNRDLQRTDKAGYAASYQVLSACVRACVLRVFWWCACVEAFVTGENQVNPFCSALLYSS